jgi:hypothetical protein
MYTRKAAERCGSSRVSRVDVVSRSHLSGGPQSGLTMTSKSHSSKNYFFAWSCGISAAMLRMKGPESGRWACPESSAGLRHLQIFSLPVNIKH